MTHTVKTALLQESTCNLQLPGPVFRSKRPQVAAVSAAKK